MSKNIEFEDFSARLDWRNLTVSTVPNLQSMSRIILSNSHGSVKPGEFLAVMGPSGAGKTTLLKCLSKRTDSSTVIDSGEILINGVSIDSLPYASMIGFVPQDNILFTSMTPREILTFTAALTSSLSYEDRRKLVTKTLEDLGLNSCADTVVGAYFNRGLSGGEKKRTSVGMELISNPSVLFLDEPTTGLDSCTALSIANLIKSLAKDNNRTIIATIHQPNSQLFGCFDKLLLLSKSVTVYIGEASEAVNYFEGLGYPLPVNYNPADHFLSVINRKDFMAKEDLETRYSVYESTELKQREVFEAPFLTELYYLTWRAYLDMVRNPLNIVFKIIKTMVFSFMTLTVFWQLDYNYQGIIDRLKCIFAVLFNYSCDAHLSVVLTFQMQKLVFLREYRQNRYGAFSYFLSYNLIVVPVEIIFCLISLLSIYYAVDFNTEGSAPFKFALVSILSGLTGSGWGMLLSIISPNSEIATVASMVIIVPSWLCSGFLINYDDISDWFFPKWIGPYYFTYQAGVYSQIEGLDGTGNADSVVIDELNLPNSYSEAIWLTVALIFAFRTLDYILIKLIYKNK